MTIEKLTGSVYPLAQVAKTNEIVDVLNSNLNLYFSTTNAYTLTPVEGVCTWNVTHNLGTENISCALYKGGSSIVANFTTTSANAISISFYSSSSVPAETYTVVIVSNGANSSSGGGGSYTLPVATTEILGGVKIDGTTIDINDGVISAVADSSLNSTSTKPVQNKIIYPSLSNFIPANTTYTVEADGSGDFATIADAVNFLTGKWSNGTVTIELGTGTFQVPNINLDGGVTNIPSVDIKGASAQTTTLEITNTSNWSVCIKPINSATLRLFDLTIKKAESVTATLYGCGAESGGTLCVQNCIIKDFDIGIRGYYKGSVDLRSDVHIENCSIGIDSTSGNVYSWYRILYFTSCPMGINVNGGGVVSFVGCTVTWSNVTTKVSQAVGTATNNGWITGITV